MDDAQRFVAFPDFVDDDAKADQIVNFTEQQILRLHLLVNGIEVFRATIDLRCDPSLGEFLLQDGDDLGDIAFSLSFLFGDILFELPIHSGMQVAQGVVFEVTLEPIDTEPVGQRSINIKGFLRNLSLFVFRQIRRACACCARGLRASPG